MSEAWGKPLPRLVGRRTEQEMIFNALASGGQAVLHIVGAAGVGKTRLLEEVRYIADELGRTGAAVVCPPILDFYDTSLHSESAIEEAIAAGLSSAGTDQAFAEFVRTLSAYREGRGSPEKLWQAFEAGYDQVSRERKIVLRFDTAELLEYEHDDPKVLRDCDVQGAEAPSLRWLEDRASQLKNTAILVANRPNRRLGRRLTRAYGERLRRIRLGTLTLSETTEYFGGSEFGGQVLNKTPETVHKIWLLTDGRPILVALALDWLRRGRDEDGFYSHDLREVHSLRKRGGEKWKQVVDAFEVALIQRLRRKDTQLDKAIYYAARARKGYDAELLGRIMNLPKQDAEQLTDQLRDLSFVKLPQILPAGRDQWYFLHDQMYDLIEQHVWQAFWPTYSEQQRIAERIVQFYQEQIDRVSKRIRQASTESERGDLHHQRQVLLTEQLYYRFDADPRHALIHYDRLDTYALSQRALEWDNLLRIEAIRFALQRPDRASHAKWVTMENGKFKITPRVNMDCRARWVHRYVAAGDYDKATRVSTKLLNKYAEAEKLWQARVLISRAAAQERMGRWGENWLFDEATRDLDSALRLLQDVTPDEFTEWVVDHSKATAHVYQGLVARAIGELQAAHAAYEKAISSYRKTGYQSGEARALNNQSFILGRQGKQAEALDKCLQALRMRQEAGDQHGVALSLNTLGIIRAMGKDFTGAVAESLRALRIFQRQQDQTGIALASINLGRAHRRLGSSNIRKRLTDIVDHFKQSEDYLLQAEKLETRLEPIYRLEIHNELGCTHKDWANLIALWGEGTESRSYSEHMAAADEQFRKAHEMVADALPMEKADNLEDWAWVYHLRFAYSKPMQHRDRAELLEKAEAKLRDAEAILQSFTAQPQPGLEGHLFLGKVYFQRANLQRVQSAPDLQAAARDYALAAIHFATYSLESQELKEVLLTILSWLHSLSRQPPALTRAIDDMEAVVAEKGAERWKCAPLEAWLRDVIRGDPRLGTEVS